MLFRGSGFLKVLCGILKTFPGLYISIQTIFSINNMLEIQSAVTKAPGGIQALPRASDRVPTNLTAGGNEKSGIVYLIIDNAAFSYLRRLP